MCFRSLYRYCLKELVAGEDENFFRKRARKTYSVYHDEPPDKVTHELFNEMLIL